MPIGKIHIPLVFFLLLLLSLFPLPALSADNAYLETLITEARSKGLGNHPYWHILLVDQEPGDGMESMVDDPAFFLSPDGKTDPTAEIEATLRAFFVENAEPDKHPRCRFVARYRWLSEQLNIDVKKLPPADCPDFDKSFERVSPKKAVLVFPASFMNSPASMFGHTLIRIDGDYESALLSYSISYAAQTGDSSGMLFAVKGIFGYYHGMYSVLPYYAKVKDYSDLEQRDIWEYELDLTEEETTRMFLHVWELRDIYSWYYFFDENCASVLLHLLEAGRPSLHVSDKLHAWAIPADTIKVIRNADIIRKRTYRPALARKVKHIASLIDDNGKENVKAVSDMQINPEDILSIPADDETKRRILDLSAEFTQYQYSKRQLEEKKFTGQILKILSARSKLGPSENGEYRIEEPTAPETGHESGRFSLGGGMRDRESFAEIRYRPAYHDLLDPGEGFLPGSQIIFGEATLRYYEAPGRLRLKHLDVIDIVSIAPRDRFFKHISWKVNTGIMESQFRDGRSHLHGVLNPAGGIAYQLGKTGIPYFFIEADLRASGRYDRNYALGIGGSAGIFGDLSDDWKAHLKGGAIAYRAGDRHSRYFGRLDQTYGFRKNMSLSLDIGWEKCFGESERDFKLNWNLYL